jgi:peptide/nickel transport system substrate-binding protein
MMKRLSIVFVAVLATVILLSPCTPQAASPTASTAKKAATSSTTAAQPQLGGIYKVLIRSRNNAFGYPPRIAGSGRDYAPPFFDRLFSVGDDGKYKPGLALSWDTSKDGKTMTFKLRQGVTFHDGTPFNAQAVKANLDDLIPPKANILSGITSIDVVDEYTVKLNLSEYNNIINYHFAANPATWMYSPEALKKNGAEWATTHPVGTGPFMLKEFVPNTSLTLVKNPNYWQKGLPYLDGIEISMIPDIMTMALTLKAGQANAIYDPQGAAAQLDAGYPLQKVPAGGSFTGINFDIKNSEIFSKRQVREAIEYAIDKEAICDGPGIGGLLNYPLYQLLGAHSPDYNKACPPRKYDPAKAKKLLAQAGYPNGFSFKLFAVDTTWKDGWVAVQSYLDKVGIKMDINYVNISQFNLIKSGKIEKGAAGLQTYPNPSNSLFMLDTYYSSNSIACPYIVKPAGIDKLIAQAKASRDSAAVTKINQQILKLLYDDVTVIPLFQQPRMAALDKSVQDTGWFINGDSDNNEFGHRTWLKK